MKTHLKKLSKGDIWYQPNERTVTIVRVKRPKQGREYYELQRWNATGNYYKFTTSTLPFLEVKMCEDESDFRKWRFCRARHISVKDRNGQSVTIQ